ncbi:hypothetical protein [Microbacterium mcarthurae (nom. nud.)]|uniref:Protein kinase domain-containing protein n=1 Tax=Microbacterium mcarthurae TaxID=3035918 RepID=A0ABW9GHA8_9MICO
MIRLRKAAAVQVDDLGLLPMDPTAAASGFEGSVVPCAEVFFLAKMYTRPRSGAEAAAIQRLIDLKEYELSPADRELAARSFSWPAHRIIDGQGDTVGVLIPRAEPRFSFPFQGGWHLLEGQHVARATSVAGTFTAEQRLRFALDLATAWDVLDRHGLVYTDANSRNILFATSGDPSTYFLDCDGVRHHDDPTLEFRTQPNWSDPHVTGASIQNDRYLLAVWVLRILSAQMVRPQPTPTDAETLPAMTRRAKVRRLVAHGLGPAGSRPAPADYVAALGGE